MNKVVKIQVIPQETEELDFHKFYQVLWDLQYECMRIANRTVQLCWEFSGFESDYKKQFNNYPDAKIRLDTLGYNSINSYIYSILSKEFIKLQTGCISTIENDVTRKFFNERKTYYIGEKSIPNYKKNIAISIHKKSIHLQYDKTENKWSVGLGILSSKYKKELGLKSLLQFNLIIRDKSSKSIIERCYDNIYQVTGSKLIYKDGKWFFNLGYAFENKQQFKFEDNLIMGVYIGRFNAVMCSFNNNSKVFKLKGGEVEEFRKKTEARRKQLLQQSTICGKGRIGHGYHTRVKPVEQIGNTIANFRDTINHRYSKAIIDFAKRNNCGIIQMENLKGISDADKFLKHWSYFDLQTKIIYKAKECGITVNIIDSKYLERRCCKCGNVLDSLNSEYYKCTNCDFEHSVDYNASQNLTIEHIDRIIDEFLKQGAKVEQS